MMGLLWQPGDTELRRIDREALLAATADERAEWLRGELRGVKIFGDTCFTGRIDGRFFSDRKPLFLTGRSSEWSDMKARFERRLHE